MEDEIFIETEPSRSAVSMGRIKAMNARVIATPPATSGEIRSRKKNNMKDPVMNGNRIQIRGALTILPRCPAERYPQSINRSRRFPVLDLSLPTNLQQGS